MARLGEIALTTDYVANGSFASLKANVRYRSQPDHAVLVRTVDFNNRWNEDYVWVDEGAYTFLSKSRLEPGDVVLSNVGSVGTVFRVPDLGRRMTLGPNAVMCRTRDPRRLDQRFLFYFFSSADGQQALRSITSGSVQPKFNKTDLRALSIALPPIDRQRAIAGILGALDDKIELNRRMNETLEAMARAIFKSWFVDFEPVRAKAAGRQPAAMDGETAALFPDSFDESALGKIPKGWQLEVLGEVLSELECGGRPKGGVAGYTFGVPSIGAESIVGLGQFDYSKTKYVPRDFFDRLTRGRVRSRDVLLYKDGGRPGEFEPHVTMFGDGFPFETCAINEHVYRLQAREKLGQNLLFFSLSSERALEEMRAKGTGVAIPGLNSTQLKSLTALVPTSGVARAFNALVEPFIARILSGCSDSRALATLRDALLPKLLSGEIRVKHPEDTLAVPAPAVP